jgi:hypothetical protein
MRIKGKVAERVGFEPTRRLPAYGISNAAPSAGLGDLSGLPAHEAEHLPARGGFPPDIVRNPM